MSFPIFFDDYNFYYRYLDDKKVYVNKKTEGMSVDSAETDSYVCDICSTLNLQYDIPFGTSKMIFVDLCFCQLYSLYYTEFYAQVNLKYSLICLWYEKKFILFI